MDEHEAAAHDSGQQGAVRDDTPHASEHATEQWEPRGPSNPRARWPKVVGIISIVLGGIFVCCGGLGLVSPPLLGKIMRPALEGAPLPYGMQLHAADYAIIAVGTALSLCLLLGGIACVTYRPITRHLHMTYAICSIPFNVWNYLNQMEKQDLNLQWAKEYPGNTLAESFARQGSGGPAEIIGLVFFLLLGIGIPLFYLIWFGLVKSRADQISGDEDGVY